GTGPGTSNPLYSEIPVSGRQGTIDYMQVELVGLSHTFPDDIDLYFGSVPTGHALLMSDCGGRNATSNLHPDFIPTSVPTTSFTTYALDDSAQIYSSNSFTPIHYYRGTNYDTAEGVGYPTDLANFIGDSPNQTWRIDARDDAAGDSGSMQ